VTRVGEQAPLNGHSQLRLPDRRTCLWITDPLWFAGVPLCGAVLADVGEWQRRTDSVVVVDGTFAYMEWEGPCPAGVASLDPDLTYRLVCPTKALALHGFRFAYAIAPRRDATEFMEFHGRMHGATSLVDRIFAHRAVELLGDRFPSRTLWPYVRQRVDAITASGAIRDVVTPTSGYFVFAASAAPESEVVGLGSGCFSATGHSEHVRINVLDDDVVTYLLGGAMSAADEWEIAPRGR
jgi:aspartate/methionine/tyrosine aminotransferase